MSARFSSNISSPQAVDQQWEVAYWKRMDLQQEIKIIYVWRHAVGTPFYQNAKYEVITRYKRLKFYMNIATRRPSDVAATAWRKILSTHFVSHFIPFSFFPRIRSYNTHHKAGILGIVANNKNGLVRILFYWVDKKFYLVR